ncbi:MAG: alkaline phosphatase family protein [Anaerofustis sp.]
MIQYPDYENSIVNIPNSVLAYFGTEPNDKTMPELDKLLAKGYSNVVVMLFDALGTEVLNRHLPSDSFLRKHVLKSVSSVYPTTTVSATTAIESGLMPNRHAWFGWTMYFPQVEKNVVVFRNTDECGGSAAEYPVAQTYLPYETVQDAIRAKGFQTYTVSPFGDLTYANLEELCGHVKQLCSTDERKYIYCYCPEPDSTMHRKGCGSSEASAAVLQINDRLEKLCAELTDTLLIVTADHGMTDTRNECILDYPSITECLVRAPSFEPRALNCFIKDGMHEQFETEFETAFGGQFLLFSRDRLKETALFGLGENHPLFDELVGDYVAVAISDVSLFNTYENAAMFVGVHAGLTDAEMNVPLIAVER